MASPARFERAAFRLGGECSILLSYGDICNFIEQASRLGGECSILLSYGDRCSIVMIPPEADDVKKTSAQLVL